MLFHLILSEKEENQNNDVSEQSEEYILKKNNQLCYMHKTDPIR